MDPILLKPSSLSFIQTSRLYARPHRNGFAASSCKDVGAVLPGFNPKSISAVPATHLPATAVIN